MGIALVMVKVIKSKCVRERMSLFPNMTKIIVQNCHRVVIKIILIINFCNLWTRFEFFMANGKFPQSNGCCCNNHNMQFSVRFKYNHITILRTT